MKKQKEILSKQRSNGIKRIVTRSKKFTEGESCYHKNTGHKKMLGYILKVNDDDTYDVKIHGDKTQYGIIRNAPVFKLSKIKIYPKPEIFK